MAIVGNTLANLFCIIARYLPFRHKTGLFRIGQPGSNAPVFVSGNYFHTVVRISKYLKGIDCYLLVADSAGINVWCAAGAGDFTEHKIADAVNTYNLTDVVDHRELILPQLSAVGVDKDRLFEECGFRAKWGPASYLDIREYVNNGFQSTDKMRHVSLSLANRLYMATGMLSSYVFFGLIIYALSCLYAGIHSGWTVLNISLLLAVQIFMAAFADRMIFKWPTTNILLMGLLISVVIGTMGIAHIVRMSAAYLYISATVLITILICLDYLGSTVDYKTTTFHWLKTFNMRSLFQPEVMDNCEGCRECINVCPKNMYYVQSGKTRVNYDNECCECLACVKQCSSGAIRNRNKARWKGDIKTIPDIDRIMK